MMNATQTEEERVEEREKAEAEWMKRMALAEAVLATQPAASSSASEMPRWGTGRTGRARTLTMRMRTALFLKRVWTALLKRRARRAARAIVGECR